MNEKIRELMLKAGYAAPELAGRAHKLAELIVQEAIIVCNSRVGNSDYNTGRMHCASDIKEHFGVKNERTN